MGEESGYKIIDLKRKRRRKKFRGLFDFFHRVRNFFSSGGGKKKHYKKYGRKNINH